MNERTDSIRIYCEYKATLTCKNNSSSKVCITFKAWTRLGNSNRREEETKKGSKELRLAKLLCRAVKWSHKTSKKKQNALRFYILVAFRQEQPVLEWCTVPRDQRHASQPAPNGTILSFTCKRNTWRKRRAKMRTMDTHGPPKVLLCAFNVVCKGMSKPPSQHLASTSS